ncbi:TonB family protein [Pseudomarimonas arenosa]|uniref:TonB family protein n=1 Tax=Pseudomarimonas arenosa TaxID=2774145 RepID=A0AAW3ZIW3_9GAMM|nr:TonB family protein [Pseudomarimonas arenosa]MBD8526023.1 TonB family protein [Pseudomarimonas arenosa]
MIDAALSWLSTLVGALPDLLLRGLVCSSAAIVLVLALRRVWRTTFGAQHAPLLWALVPASLLALLLPGPEPEQASTLLLGWLPAQAAATLPTPTPETSVETFSTRWIWWLWGLGCLLLALLLIRQQRNFLRALGTLRARADGSYLASSNHCGPAVIGLWRPRVVLPADFEHRYDSTQQSMILCHEQSHARRGDVPANALASALRCLYWFNPLVHFAADRLRHDHELAADAAVVSRFPQHRKTYAETLLKVQLAVPGLPVGCLWQSSHPLKERITMLRATPSSKTRNVIATALASALFLATAGVVWASKPAQPAAVEAESTPEFAAMLQLEIDGQSTGPILGFSKHAGFVVETANWRIDGSYHPDRAGEDLILQLSYQGQAVTTQRFEVKLGDPFSVSATAGSPLSKLSLSGRVETFDPAMTNLLDGKTATYRRLKPPRYPQEAIDAGVSGWVVVRALVGKDGLVHKAEVQNASPSGVFEQSSLDTVRAWTFNPATRDGEPVAEWVQVPICFSMEEDRACEVPQSALDTIVMRPPAPHS